MLAVYLLLIIAIIFPPASVYASAPGQTGRIFHNPIVVHGPVSAPGMKPNVIPYAISPPFTPAQIRKAYGIDQFAGDGTGKTIAIVDAYGCPTVAADLAYFSQQMNLPAANFLPIVYPTGQPNLSDPSAKGWEMETSLDVQWAHAMAPGANILLVVAPTAYSNDLLSAVDYASSHADIVSMSWGGAEYAGEVADDSYFNHAGVTYLASSGDSGASVTWPASSPNVVGVGGTTLTINNDGTYGSESAWSGSGGGQSIYENQPSYQNGFQNSGYRQVPDVAFDASSSPGVIVYNSTPDANGNTGWFSVGGTSVGAPCWAGLYALANHSGVPWVYNQAAAGIYSSNYHDITTGSNGTPLYNAGTGYDMVTGLGSPIFNSLAFGPATRLVMTAQPSNATAGSAFTTQPVVTLQDSNGKNVTSSNAAVTIAISTNPSGGTLSGNLTVNAINGVATFSGLSIDKAGAGYTLTASSAGLSPAISSGFNVSAGSISKLNVSGYPSSTAAGAANNFTLTAQDALGNTVTGYNGTVHFISSDGQAGLPPDYTFVGSDNGTHTFNATLKTAGTQSITATDTVTSSITGSQSGITVNPGGKNKLIWGTQPPSTVAAGATWAGFTVKIVDQYGNQTSDTDSVTIAPSSGALGGTLSNTSVVGLATFNNISRTIAGNLTLTATSGTLTAAPASNTVTVNAAAASQVRVESAASGSGNIIENTSIIGGNSITGYAVTRDQYGNYIANVAGAWSLVNKTGEVVNADLVPSPDGKSAVFTAHLAGACTIHVASPNLTSVDSGSITVSPAGKNKLIWGTQPPSTVAAGATWAGFSVKIVDQYGNQTSDTDSVTIAPSSGTLSGTLSNTSVVGLATFTNISRTLAGNLTLTATSGTLTAAPASNTVTVNAAAASQVRVESAANGSGIGVAAQNLLVGSSLTVYAVTRDQYGNYIANVAGNWSLVNKTGSVADTDLIAGTDGKSAVLTAHLPGAGTIHVTSPNLISVDSGSITVSSLAPTPTPTPTPTPSPVISGGSGGGGGGGSPPPVIKPVTLSGFNSTTDLKVDSSGNVQGNAELNIEDGSATLDITKNTRLVDAKGKALDTLSATILSSVSEPPPPQSVIVRGYEFGPDGAQFSPPLTLTLTYDPQSLPAGADGSKLTLAFWDGSRWEGVDSKVDIATNTLTAQISHFSEYALLAQLPPARFTLSDLKITEDKSSPDNPVTIQTVVTNIGGSPGKYTLNLTLNSFGVNKQEVTLDSGKSQTVSFELKNLIPAKYVVDINGTSSQFTIEEPSGVTVKVLGNSETAAEAAPIAAETPAPTSTAKTSVPLPEAKATIPLIWLILAVVVAGGLITSIILSRRKAKG